MTRRVFERASTTNTSNIVVTKQVRDDAAGSLPGTQGGGLVDYADPLVRFMPTDIIRSRTWSDVRSTEGGDSGTWVSTETTDSWGAGSLVRVWYRPASAVPSARSETLPAQPIRLRLTPYTADAVIPGSVQFQFAGATYIDRDGDLIVNPDPVTGIGLTAGTINYRTGDCAITWWPAGQTPTFVLQSLATIFGQFTDSELMFLTAGAPLQPGGFNLSVTAADGELITVTVNLNGEVTSDHAEGAVMQEHGVVRVKFGTHTSDPLNPSGPEVWVPRQVLPDTARYNAVIRTYLPLSADVLGLDPVRLPMDGRVRVVREGYVGVLHHTGEFVVASPQPGDLIDCGRTRLARIRVEDATGARVPADRIAALDLDAGTFEWANPLNTVEYPTPWTVHHTIEDSGLISDADIGGRIVFTRALTHHFPVPGSYLSTALYLGNLWARATNWFTQQTWTGVWSDSPIGSGTTGQYNIAQWPILVTNRGTVTEDWRITFQGTENFILVGRTLGQVAVGTRGQDLAPINPANGQPYFILRWQGWSDGWVSQNTARFRTIGPKPGAWSARCVLQGASTGERDQARFVLRGDVNQ